MQNRRERRKMLKNLGLLEAYKKSSTLQEKIQNGKEIHRKHLQEAKNDSSTKNDILETEVFTYRNEENEYLNFSSLLNNNDWTIEN